MEGCAFDLGKRGYALTEKQCVGCKFRKTNKELEEGRETARKRIASLPIVDRAYIKNKYKVI